MTVSSIITHVQTDPQAENRLAAAVALAARWKARLIGVGAEMIPPLAFDNGYYSVDAEWVTAMRESIEAQLVKAKAVFTAAAAALPSADLAWVSGIDTPNQAIALASRAAELIVAGGGRREGESPYRDVSAGELALQAGRPVLVAPAGALSLDRLVVAWKDSRESRRALADALPLMDQAQAVQILEVCSPDGEADAHIRTDDVVAALQRRGIKAEAKVASLGHHAVSEVIMREAQAFGAGLIVLGCYGHSRLGEWVFGGVTRDLLAQDRVGLLLSH